MRTTFLTKILLQDVMNESVIDTGGWFETVSKVPKLWLHPKLYAVLLRAELHLLYWCVPETYQK